MYYYHIEVDHAVVASLFIDEKGREVLGASKRTLNGYLVGHNGTIVRKISIPNKQDRLVLRELVDVSGIGELDSGSNGPSVRERGAVIKVTIFYHNHHRSWFGTR